MLHTLRTETFLANEKRIYRYIWPHDEGLM